MKARKLILTLLLGVLGLPAFGDVRPAEGSGCNPNGHLFNLAPLVNASLHGQANESVGLIRGRGSNGTDLVVGAGLDYRQLQFLTNFPNDVYYVQRDNDNCTADFDGGLPAIGGFQSLPGYPQVFADAAHDAFFIADSRYNSTDEILGVGIVKAASVNLLNGTNCPNGTQSNPASCWNGRQECRTRSGHSLPLAVHG